MKSMFLISTLFAAALMAWTYAGCQEADNPSGADADSDSDSDTNPLDWDEDWSPGGYWGAEGDLDNLGDDDDDDSGGDTDADSDGDTDGDSDWDDDDDDTDSGGDIDTDVDTDSDTDTQEVDAGMPDSGTRNVMPERKTIYLSADDSNSQSSPVLVRALIENGRTVPSGQIRIWEFFNYYDFSYEPPTDAPLSVSQQMRPYNIEDGLYALQIGVQGKSMSNNIRRPLNITLILDTSGSMSGSPIALLKETCRAIAASLRPGDRISMVTWNTAQNIPLHSLAVDGPNDPLLLVAINSLDANGGTDLNAGLTTGYALARENFMENGLNRVVLISDGGANVGITDENIIAEAAQGAEDEAIYMVGVGVGDSDSYNDLLMDTVTDLGKGASIYIDSEEEAHKMFEDRFLANMEVVALDVRVEMTLPPFFDIDKFFGEEYSEEPSEVEPQHLAPNDAMIYQQLIKTTEPDQVYAGNTIDLKVTYTDAITGNEGEINLSSTFQNLIDSPCNELRKGDAIVVYAQTIVIVNKLTSEGDDGGALAACQRAITIITDSAQALQDPDLDEIASLTETYCENAGIGF